MIIKFIFFNLTISKTDLNMIDKNGKDVEVSLGWTLLDNNNLYLKIDETKYIIEKIDGSFNVYNDNVKSGSIKLQNGSIIINIGKETYRKKSEPINENISQSKKILGDYEKEEVNKGNIEKVKEKVSYTREILEKNNSLGYMGLFTKLIIDDFNFRNSEIKKIIEYILDLKPILSDIRMGGKKINIQDFETFEDLYDGLINLKKWRYVNSFFRKFPPQQKNLIWVDGYFTKYFNDKKYYIEKFILTITPEKEKRFLSKISSIKTEDNLIKYIKTYMESDYKMEDIIKIVQEEEDAVITYANNGILVFAVFSYEALCRTAIDCGTWCIIRQKNFYNSYLNRGFKYGKDVVIQYVVYNFNLTPDDDNRVIGFTICANYDDYNLHVFALHNRSDDVPTFKDYDTNKDSTEFSYLLIIANMNHYIYGRKVDINKAKRYKKAAEYISPSMDYLVNKYLINKEVNKRTQYIDKSLIGRLLRKKYISDIIDFLD